MKQHLSKIVLIIVIAGLTTSCNSIKRVAEDDHLLVKSTITIDDKVNNTELINNLLYQRPNRKMLGVPLRLYIYNTARPNIDSLVNTFIDKKPKRRERLEKLLSKKQLNRYIQTRKNFNNWIKRTGEAPVVIDEEKANKSIARLKKHYFNNGWFDVNASYEIDKKDNKFASIKYKVKKGEPYIIDSLSTQISSPVIDSLYQLTKEKTFIKENEQYKTLNFILERDRLTNTLRNSGVYHFTQDYVLVDIDTIGATKKVNVDLKIQDRAIRVQDFTNYEPFQIYKIKDVNIITNYSYERRNDKITDSITYNGYNLYSYGKLRFKPKALTDAIFIAPGNVFKDIERTQSYRHLSELRTFNYPDIDYIENPDTTLTANIYLTRLKKFKLGFSTEISQSNIQTVGLSVNPSLSIRNIFRGAETLELSARGLIGASKDAANDSDKFFDINELGLDLNLTIPRLFSPFNTEKVVPKYMLPSTKISLSMTGQTNIGLDKQTFNTIFNYKWNSSNQVTNRLDVFNIKYVRNLNTNNYFGVYQNSYNTLNNIAQDINYINSDESLSFPEETDDFIETVLSDNPPSGITEDQIQTVNSVDERKERLTENNLIFSTNFNYTKDKRESLFDEDFSLFRFKLELAGNLLSTTSRLLGLEKNSNDHYELFNVAYSQYIKTEFDYIKHWDLGKKNVFAFRTFFGIAIPYGNSTNIPFSKSFFAGGANDNRAWTAYNLGPGSSKSVNEFNEANLKLAFNLEHRFNLFGDLNGALFVDAGNIWNVLDDVENDEATFSSFSSLKDMAIGSGFGFRYDFSYFVFRLDIGFKTYDPSNTINKGWFNNYNFKNAVYNVGINYPF